MEMNGTAQRSRIKYSVWSRYKDAFLKIALPVIGGIIIGILTTLILTYTSGAFNF